MSESEFNDLPYDDYEGDDDGYDDEQYWTCAICGGEYWDGGTSCDCPERDQ